MALLGRLRWLRRVLHQQRGALARRGHLAQARFRGAHRTPRRLLRPALPRSEKTRGSQRRSRRCRLDVGRRRAYALLPREMVRLEDRRNFLLRPGTHYLQSELGGGVERFPWPSRVHLSRRTRPLSRSDPPPRPHHELRRRKRIGPSRPDPVGQRTDFVRCHGARTRRRRPRRGPRRLGPADPVGRSLVVSAASPASRAIRRVRFPARNARRKSVSYRHHPKPYRRSAEFRWNGVEGTLSGRGPNCSRPPRCRRRCVDSGWQ